MTIYRGVGGVNREIKQQFRGVGGVNREIKEQYRGVGGVNRKVFSNVPAGALYWQGFEYTTLTGGWQGYYGPPTVTKYSTYMNIMRASAATGSRTCPVNNINITGYKKLKLYGRLTLVNSEGNLAIALTNDRNIGGDGIANSTKSLSTSDKVGDIVELELDISSFSGNYIISVGVYYAGMDVYKIWLE